MLCLLILLHYLSQSSFYLFPLLIQLPFYLSLALLIRCFHLKVHKVHVFLIFLRRKKKRILPSKTHFSSSIPREEWQDLNNEVIDNEI